MRLLIRGLLLASVASPVFAADVDNSWLRGSSSFPADPPPFQRWNGFYGGGQLGADFRGVDFRGATGAMVGNVAGQDGNLTGIPLSGFNQLPVLNTKGPSFGGFAGYNYQVDDVVMGFELNLNGSPVEASTSDSQSRNFLVCVGNQGSTSCQPPNRQAPTTFTVTSSASAKVTDYGSARVRFGWAYGSFLPYVFGGFSVSQINTTRSVNVTYAEDPRDGCGLTCIGNAPNGQTQSDISHGKWGFGFDFGVGVDYALTRNIFLRGEVEYLQLGSSNDIKINTTSVRAGAGLKF
jgi:outer membrane immunogenic protein